MSRRGECEVFDSESGVDYESWEKWMACKKNPGHSDFISVKNLTITDIPEEARCKANFDWIKLISDLTVRIRVNNRSSARPSDDFIHPVSGLCSGTGRILNVYPGSGPCPCGIRFNKPCSKNWWGYNILTANHVVFDSEEACWTRVDLFCDEDAPEQKMMKTLIGVKAFDSSVRQDWCNFQAVSHDENLADTINWALLKFWKLRIQHGKWNKAASAVIVSHPHCQPKKVTFGVEGYWDAMKIIHPIGYTAATCSGSSGAGVFPLPVASVFVCSISKDFVRPALRPFGNFFAGFRGWDPSVFASDSNCVHSSGGSFGFNKIVGAGGKLFNKGFVIPKYDAFMYTHKLKSLPGHKLPGKNSSEYKQFFW